MFSPNSRFPDEVPPYHAPKWNPTVDEIKKLGTRFFMTPQWYRGVQYSWMCTVPHHYHDSQNGSIFDIFRNENLPPCGETLGPNQFRMPDYLAAQWKSFQDSAKAVVGTIFEHMHVRTAGVVTLPGPDVLAGYLNVHRSSRIVARQAYQSRNWFTILIGTLIYACLRGWAISAVQGGKEIIYRPQDMPSATMREQQGRALEVLTYLVHSGRSHSA